MKIKKVGYYGIGCIPVTACPEHPSDQMNCIKELCPACKNEIWVSEKKRALRDNLKLRCLCLVCLFNAMIADGIDPKNIELVDIGNSH